MTDTLFDRVVRHQVQIERLKSGESNRVNKIIKANDEEILSFISSISENYTQKEINSLIKLIKDTNSAYYSSVVAKTLRSLAVSIVSFETEFSENTLTKFLSPEIPTRIVSRKETLGRVLNEKYDGKKLSGWIAALSKDKTKRLEKQIRMSTTSGDSPEKILISAKKAISVSNSNNQAVTRAYINQSVNISRDEVYSRNDEKVVEIIWSSILDGGTTLTCGVRSNKRYDAKTKEPIGHNNDWNGGPGIIHWGCRSIGIPADKDNLIASGSGEGYLVGSGSRTAIGAEKGYERGDNKNEQGKRFKIPSKNNSLEVEVVSGRTSYETWLKTQPKAFVEDAIGVTKANAFLSGKATLGDFVVESGRELTVKQLTEKLKLN